MLGLPAPLLPRGSGSSLLLLAVVVAVNATVTTQPANMQTTTKRRRSRASSIRSRESLISAELLLAEYLLTDTHRNTHTGPRQMI